MSEFKTTHDLPFLSRHWEGPLNDEGWQEFLIGTCIGQWRSTPEAYEILTIINREPGNGHLVDVFEYFERSCRRDKKALLIRELMNENFENHLITKRGFTKKGDDLIKHYS